MEDLFSQPNPKYRPWFLAAFVADKTDRCALCEHWQSNDGKQGECNGPELKVGTTRAIDGCEQFSIVNIEGEELYKVRGYDMQGKPITNLI